MVTSQPTRIPSQFCPLYTITEIIRDDSLNRESRLPNQPGSTTGREQTNIVLDQALRQVKQSSLVVDGEDRCSERQDELVSPKILVIQFLARKWQQCGEGTGPNPHNIEPAGKETKGQKKEERKERRRELFMHCLTRFLLRHPETHQQCKTLEEDGGLELIEGGQQIGRAHV